MPAAARQLTIQNFNIQINVHADSTIEVTETLEVRFEGAWNGIYRTIPVEYSDSLGFTYSLFFEAQSITDAAGNAAEIRSQQPRTVQTA